MIAGLAARLAACLGLVVCTIAGGFAPIPVLDGGHQLAVLVPRLAGEAEAAASPSLDQDHRPDPHQADRQKTSDTRH
jgi:membrane-associated protease RseP (regulator of RpoE activity)